MPSAEGLTVMKGTLDVLVLKALAWAPMHGFEITAWLEARCFELTFDGILRRKVSGDTSP